MADNSTETSWWSRTSEVLKRLRNGVLGRMVKALKERFLISWRHIILSVLSSVLLLAVWVTAYQRYGVIMSITILIAHSLIVSAIKFGGVGYTRLNKTPDITPRQTIIEEENGKTQIKAVDMDVDNSILLSFAGEENVAKYVGTKRELIGGDTITLEQIDAETVQVQYGSETETVTVPQETDDSDTSTIRFRLHNYLDGFSSEIETVEQGELQ